MSDQQPDDIIDILLIEDEAAHAELICRAFADASLNTNIRLAATLAEAQTAIDSAPPNLILTDFRLPDGYGTDLLPAGKDTAVFPVVVMTSHGDEHVAVEAIKAGALDYVAKSPEIFAEMPRVVERAMREWGHIIERRRVEEMYTQAQRLETVGRLAAGIAHDFNNLLTAINGSAALIKLELPANHDCIELADNILHSGSRAADLVRQLLAFSRRQVIAPKIVSLHEVIAGLAKILPRVIGEDIEVEYQVDDDLMLVKVDPAQLEQVVLNLAVNARDAMRSGGRLTIQVRNTTLTEAVAGALGLAPGEHVAVSVIDTGTGMSKEIQERIFEPFFTTKEVGKGTGLGLATVFGIVKQSGGGIAVESVIGVGTTFRIYLPRSADATTDPANTDGNEHQPRGEETVLVVEDDAAVRELIERALDTIGYSLLLAQDAESALELVAQHRGAIDVLVTDVVLPGMTGKALADEVMKRRPGTCVLFISGYSEEAIAHHGVLSPGVPLLQKPFTPQRLAQELRTLLDHRTKPPQ